MTALRTHKAPARFASLALALTVLVIAAPAQARMSAPALDSFSAACWDLQQKGDRLIAEYKNASNERREQLLQEIRSNGLTWRQIGCQGVFGDISRIVLTPGGLRNGITWDMLMGSDADSGDHHKPSHDTAPGGDVFLY